jgi:hypothetical protein
MAVRMPPGPCAARAADHAARPRAAQVAEAAQHRGPPRPRGCRNRWPRSRPAQPPEPQAASNSLDQRDHASRRFVDDPVRRLGYTHDPQVRHPARSSPCSRPGSKARSCSPHSTVVGTRTVKSSSGSTSVCSASCRAGGRAQRRSAVVVQRAGQALAPGFAVAVRAVPGSARPCAAQHGQQAGKVRARPAGLRHLAGRGSSCRRWPPAARGCRAVRAGRPRDAVN